MALAVILGNLGVFLFMLVISLAWNAFALLRKRGRVSDPVFAYVPDRKVWQGYYWRRVKGYVLSYLVVFTVLFLMSQLSGRASTGAQLLSILLIMPGLVFYFVLAGFIPARYTIYPEGFSTLGLIPFLPGRRDKKTAAISDFRVGLRLWRKYHDVIHQGDLLILKSDFIGTELIIPRGKRDYLLNLVRDGLKLARNERKQNKQKTKDVR